MDHQEVITEPPNINAEKKDLQTNINNFNSNDVLDASNSTNQQSILRSMPPVSTVKHGNRTVTSMPRISSRGYSKPLPKLTATMRNSQLMSSDGNNSQQPTNDINTKASPSQPSLVQVEPKKTPPKLPPRGVPKRPASVSPKTNVRNHSKTDYLLSSTIGPLATGTNPRNETAQNIESQMTQEKFSPAASPRQHLRTSLGSRESDGNDQQIITATKRRSRECQPISTGQSQTLPKGMPYQRSGRDRKHSRDQTMNLSHPKSSLGPTPHARQPSKDLPFYSSSRGEGNQVIRKTARDPSASQPAVPRRIHSSQNVLIPSGLTREPSLEENNLPPKPRVNPLVNQTNINSNNQPKGSSGGMNHRVVPKLALGTISNKELPQASTDPYCVVPQYGLAKTARDRTNTHFIEGKSIEAEPKPRAMYSSTVSNTNVITTPKKPLLPNRYATVSGRSDFKPVVRGASKRKWTTHLAFQYLINDYSESLAANSPESPRSK